MDTAISERMGLARVLDEDPDLAQQLEPAQAETASRRAIASVASLPKGEFSPHETLLGEGGILGLLVLEGLLLRGVCVANRYTIEVLGTGDLVRPFEPEADPHATVPLLVRWWALRPARLAVLDASFTQRMSEYPEVMAELAGRLSRGSAAGSVRLAIVQQPQLSVRLHFMLWHLADRFGRVHSDGVVLPVPLCDGLLACLVGARRSPVNRAVKELERAGRIARRPDGSWWLDRQPPEGFSELALDDPQRIAA